MMMRYEVCSYKKLLVYLFVCCDANLVKNLSVFEYKCEVNTHTHKHTHKHTHTVLGSYYWVVKLTDTYF